MHGLTPWHHCAVDPGAVRRVGVGGRRTTGGQVTPGGIDFAKRAGDVSKTGQNASTDRNHHGEADRFEQMFLEPTYSVESFVFIRKTVGRVSPRCAFEPPTLPSKCLSRFCNCEFSACYGFVKSPGS